MTSFQPSGFTAWVVHLFIEALVELEVKVLRFMLVKDFSLPLLGQNMG